MSDNRCGTCRWWGDHGRGPDGSSLRMCQWPVPIWMKRPVPAGFADPLRSTESGDGTDCPCWEKAEDEE